LGRKHIFGRAQTIALVGEAAERGLAKIKRDGTKAQLDDEERVGLEAVVSVYGRPALLVENGHFRPPDPPWEKLEQHRAAIESALQSVGRIEVTGHPEEDCVGTGFLVADDVVMTNRHVAKKFLVGPPDWPFESGMTARIDFNEEFLGGEPREFALTEVVGVSLDVDIALLRVKTANGGTTPLPPPLRISGALTVSESDDIYAIGYPFYDPRPGVDLEVLHRIFSDLYGIKRVQPGQVRSLEPEKHEFVHDCSTLGGNSGSCVIDLETGEVVGLHRSGRYLQGNFAIALSEVKDDPVMKAAQLRFS
jgi:S1-C subfamily serine protease